MSDSNSIDPVLCFAQCAPRDRQGEGEAPSKPPIGTRLARRLALPECLRGAPRSIVHQRTRTEPEIVMPLRLGFGPDFTNE
jgi:hypothetical protein